MKFLLVSAIPLSISCIQLVSAKTSFASHCEVQGNQLK